MKLEKHNSDILIVLFAGILWSFGALIVRNLENPSNSKTEIEFGGKFTQNSLESKHLPAGSASLRPLARPPRRRPRPPFPRP